MGNKSGHYDHGWRSNIWQFSFSPVTPDICHEVWSMTLLSLVVLSSFSKLCLKPQCKDMGPVYEDTQPPDHKVLLNSYKNSNFQYGLAAAWMVKDSFIHSFTQITASFDKHKVLSVCSLLGLEAAPRTSVWEKHCPASGLRARLCFLYPVHVMWTFSFPQFVYLT